MRSNAISLLLVTSFFFLFSCNGKKQIPAWEGRVRKHIAPRWVLHLPPNAIVDIKYSTSLLDPSLIKFPGDSLFVSYHFGSPWIESPADRYEKKPDCSFRERMREVNQMAVGGLCEGDGDGYTEYSPYINEITGLTGLILYSRSESGNAVSILITECETQEYLQLSFLSVNHFDRRFIQQTLRSIEFVK